MSEAAHELTLFVEGDALYDGMLADIAGAQSAIRLESYIFADDEVGSQFIVELGRAAQSAIATTLRLDAAGSLSGLRRSNVAKLANAGVDLEWSGVASGLGATLGSFISVIIASF